ERRHGEADDRLGVRVSRRQQQRGQTAGTREPSEWQHAQNSPIGSCILVSRVRRRDDEGAKARRDWVMKLLTIVSVLGFTVVAAAQPPPFDLSRQSAGGATADW